MGQGNRKGTSNQVQVRENIQYSFNANHRETMEALARAKFTNEEYRVILALLNETDGRLRDDCDLTSTSWQALTLLSRQNVHRALRQLALLNVIIAEGQAYRVTHPNEWVPKAFQPHRLAARAVEALRAILRAEKEKHNFRWLSRLSKSVSPARRSAPPATVSPARRKRLAGETEPSRGRDALGGTIGGDETRRDIPTPKGVARRKGRAPPDPRIKEILTTMGADFGFPEKTDIDPIPSYGKEGTAIKRMLTRGFTPMAILAVWRGKVKQRGKFVSMVWVNEDIREEVERGELGEHPAPGSGKGFDFGELRDTAIEPD